MRSKKGVSPLVATVLLIAFAVALGAVVMSWSGQVVSKINTCGETSIQFELIQNAEDVCFSPSEQLVFFTLRNNGEAIEGLSTTAIGTRSSSNQNTPIGIPAYQIQKVAIPYRATDLGSIQKLVVTPFFERSSGPEICKDKSIEVADIPTCDQE